MNINSPIPQEWENYVTQTNLGLETIPGMLYSVKAYTSGTTTILSFFDFVNASRPDLTNMQQASMLPNPESFLIQNIRVFYQTSVQSDGIGAANNANLVSGFNDVIQLSKNGILKLKIGNKSYGPWPLWTLPAHNFVKGSIGGGSPTSTLDYGQVDGYLYSLFPNLMIAPLQQFSVTLEWPGGPLTLSTTGGSLPIEVLFDGQAARSIQ